MLALVSRQGHPRKILGLHGLVIDAGKHDRSQRVLAVAGMIIIRPGLTLNLVLAEVWLVFAVGNRAPVDIVAEELGRALNGRINLRTHHPGLLPQRDRELGRQSGRVHRPVPAHRAMGSPRLPAAGRRDIREPVASGAEHTRMGGRIDDILTESMKHLGVVGQHVIFGEKDAVIAIPRREAGRLQVQILRRERPGVGLHDGQVGGIAGRQKGQRADGSPPVIAAPPVRVDLKL